MTEEPIYECEVCGATLEKWQQGRYRWCTTCQKVWDDGFNTGIQHYKTITACDTPMEIASAYEAVAPYIIRKRIA